MEEVQHSTLTKLRYYDESYKLKRKMIDEVSYVSGIYTYEAVAIAVSNSFSGKGHKPLEYRKKPIMEEMDENLSEAELQRQRELFVASLNVMKSNFELSKRAARD